ncbi:hypothetical protein A2127_00920 [Candidatus Jorgensenbacteria bacterium GWC1_48_12]|uniref:Band 7 domain-containing protein n=1 Tax=Candidatus Jorgensenbacteria bacterium GWC1_48_12 TaxID=1798469 RepID=A0A1F6BM05_9BACT|nr:MAG: hypothetical protein A2127_00920 [Candidatus Jorgensenbacteria bacterium GWC1_48_12]
MTKIVAVCAAALAILGAVIGSFTNAWFGLAFFVAFFGGFILEGLRRIPAKPPHMGQLTIRGKRIPGEFRNEGWNFFPLYPYWYGFVLVKVERIPFTVTVQGARTPDRAESRIPVLITLRPLPGFLTQYIDSGEEEGVRTQIEGKIQERVREWAMGAEEGPADWVELNRSQLEGTSVLVKQIASDSVTEIPKRAQDVPTWIWLRYYAEPQPTKFLKNEKPWARNKWRKVRDVLAQIEHDHGPGEVEKLKTAVRGRKEEIDQLRTGSGNVVLQDLGCRLERLNLGEISVLGGVGEKAEAQARENEERQAEEVELRFVRARIKELMAPPFKYSAEQALEIVQTERGKVVKTVAENKLNISPETRTMVERIVPDIAAAIAGRR